MPTKLSEYAEKYDGIIFSRSDGVLEMTIHTRGGSAKWGMSTTCLHTQLPEAFLDVAGDPENRVVILAGTGKDFIAEFDPTFQADEPSGAEMWPRIYHEGVGLLNCLIPGFDGAYFTNEWKEAVWARYSMGAPQRLRQSVERYSIVKRA